MPPTQVEFDDGKEALYRIVYVGHWKKGFRMSHEATNTSTHQGLKQRGRITVLCYSLQHGFGLEDEGR